jgi:hypothetical protein
MKNTKQNSITTRAMLISLNIQQWTGSKHDKKVSEEVAVAHQSDVSMGRFQKRLVAKEALEKLRGITSAARHEHYNRTLPWQDGGSRILSSKGYFDYSEKMREYSAQWDTAVAEFIADYPNMVQDARRRLNGLFKDEDYPTVQRMKRKFSFKFDVLPMPTAKDFRVELGDEETARVRSEIEQSVNESIRAAMADVWARLHEVVTRMQERLTVYSVDKDGAVSHAFRDSIVGNIRELLDTLPTLNITEDNNLTEIAQQIEQELCAHTPDELREDEAARKQTAEAAEQILTSMEAYL